MVQTIIKPKKVKELAKTDIVFCVDLSESMDPCIEGVKQNIHKFVENIENEPDISIDWRLGILGHSFDDNTIYFVKKEFTDNINEFQSIIGGIDSRAKGYNEANLPALDWSLDFPWLVEAHKFIVMFTDEGVDGGWDPQKSRNSLEELINKIVEIGASVYIVSFEGSEFSDYKQIGTTDKCDFIGIKGYSSFDNVQFDELMNKLGKSVSLGSRGVVSEQKVVKKDLYNIKPILDIQIV